MYGPITKDGFLPRVDGCFHSVIASRSQQQARRSIKNEVTEVRMNLLRPSRKWGSKLLPLGSVPKPNSAPFEKEKKRLLLLLATCL